MAIDRRPTAIGYKAFLGLATLPTALGAVPLPGSLADGPDIYGLTAAIAVCLGCAISLLGLLWRGKSLTGVTIEQVGLVFIVVGLSLYAVALLGVHFDAAAATTHPVTGICDFFHQAGVFLRIWFADISFAFGLSGGLAVAAAWQSVVIWRYRRRHVVQDG